MNLCGGPLCISQVSKFCYYLCFQIHEDKALCHSGKFLQHRYLSLVRSCCINCSLATQCLCCTFRGFSVQILAQRPLIATEVLCGFSQASTQLPGQGHFLLHPIQFAEQADAGSKASSLYLGGKWLKSYLEHCPP